ncbi:MAG: TolC family protein [Desulfobulbaceae bacterium]|nr:TolC family protein [Desulfobulbaceae bacterium]
MNFLPTLRVVNLPRVPLLLKKSGTILPLIASTLTFWGCAMHQSDIDSALITPPDRFTEGSAKAGATNGADYWAPLFSDTRLRQLIAEALQNNQDILRAGAKNEQIAQLEIIQSAPLLPLVSIGGAAGPEQQVNERGEMSGNRQNFSVAASYEIDLWRKVDKTADSASLNTAVAKQELLTLHTAIIARTTELYYTLSELRGRLMLHDSRIDLLKRYLEGVELRYQKGISTSAELYQARKDLLDAKAGRATLAEALADATHGLALLLGRFQTEQAITPPEDIPTPDADFLAMPPAELLDNRPDVRAAFLRLQARDAEIAAAVAGRYPSFSLTGQYGMNRMDFGTVISGNFWNLLISAAQPLFDGGRKKAEVARSKAAFKEYLADYHQSVLRAFQEAEDALAAVETRRQRLSLLRQQLDSARGNSGYGSDMYRLGITDALTLAKNGLGELLAEEQVLMEKRSLLSARISLFRALGGPYQIEIASSTPTIAQKDTP